MRLILCILCVLFSGACLPAHLEMATSLPLVRARQIAVQGDLAWVAQNFDGATLLDISDGERPKVRRHFGREVMQPLFLKYLQKEQMLLSADRFRGLVIYDVRRADAPTTVSVLPLTGMTTHIEVTETTDGKRLALLARTGAGVACVDISDPARPKITDEFAMGVEFTRAVTVADGLVYAADGGEGGLKVLRLVSPGKFVPLYQVNLFGSCENLLVHNDVLIAGYLNYGTNIFRLPRNPEDESTTPVMTILSTALRNRSHLRAMTVRDNLLYTANDRTGVDVFDISDPALPVLVDEYLFKNEPALAQDCVLSGNVLYVAGWEAGVLVFRLNKTGNGRPGESVSP